MTDALIGKLVGIDALLINALAVADGEVALRLTGCRELVADALTAAKKPETTSVVELTSSLAAIHAATRDDAKGEWWTLRRWCDQRGIFHDDIQGGERLTGIVAGEALKRFTGTKP